MWSIFPITKTINSGVLPDFCPLSHNIQFVIKSWHFYLLNVSGIMSFSAISYPLLQFKLSLSLFGLLQSLPNWSCCFGTNHLIQGLANYIAHGPNPVCYPFFKKIFYWNTAILIYLPVVYCCFYATAAQLNSCDRDCLAHKAQNIYDLALYR